MGGEGREGGSGDRERGWGEALEGRGGEGKGTEGIMGLVPPSFRTWLRLCLQRL